MSFTAYIYTLSNPLNGEVRYVGKTNDLTKRARSHLRSTSERYPKSFWVRSLQEKGYSPLMECVEEIECDREEDWETSERFWIAYFRFLGFRLLNLDNGGNGGRKRTKATCDKIRLLKTGTKMSSETRQKMSEAGKRRGFKLTLEHMQKMRAAYRPRTEAENRHHSAMMKGKIQTLEHRMKVSAGLTGHKRTDAEKASVSLRMRSRTPEQIMEQARKRTITFRARRELV